jgi:ribonuclease III
MTAGGDAAFTALERRIGHTFVDRQLLRTALTHASASDSPVASYQRLEFLGDRVLALVVSEMLIGAFPNASEGELSRRLAALVRNEACADVARALDLGAALRLGGGEVQSGGRQNAAILGDVCEALLGALYLDGGLPAARPVIEENWRERMLAINTMLRDPKTTLQEWAQAKGLATPMYTIVGRSGPDHAPRFEVEVTVPTLLPSRGTGRTRRDAEQDAATAALVREGVRKGEGNAA